MIIPGVLCVSPVPGGTSYTSSGTITLDHTQCGTADSTDFPVLVQFTNTKLKTVANGGQVQNASGFDIVFSSTNLGSNMPGPLLSWQVESWNGTTGDLLAWVKSPVSHTVDSVICIFVGNATISTFQGGATGAAWTNNFIGVWHFPDGVTLGLSDSTANGLTMTNFGATATSGIVDGAALIITTNHVQQNSTTALQFNWNSPFSVSMWFTFTAGTEQALISNLDTASGFKGWEVSHSNRLGIDSIELFLINSYPTAAIHIFALSNLPAASFNYITVTYDGSGAAAGVTLYQAGVPVTSSTLFDTLGTASTTNGLNTWVGLRRDGSDPMSGSMDELRVANGVRSASWILTEFNNQSNPATFITVVL